MTHSLCTTQKLDLSIKSTISTIISLIKFHNLTLYRMNGPGFPILSIDNLPAELPLEASKHFSERLYPFIRDLAASKSNEILNRASITTRTGDLAEKHKHLHRNLTRAAQQKTNRRVLLLGSGRVAAPLVDYFLKTPGTTITVGSNSLDEARALCADRPKTKASLVPVTDSTKLAEIVREHDIVISFVPAFLHPHVAKACIKEGKHMVTASYISPELEELEKLYVSVKFAKRLICNVLI